LQNFFRLHRAVARDASINRENRTDRHIHIDVRGAVQWIDAHDVFRMLRYPGIDEDTLVMFFRCNHAAFAAATQCRYKLLVGVYIELLLPLPLRIGGTIVAEDINKPRLIDLPVNNFGGDTDITEKP